MIFLLILLNLNKLSNIILILKIIKNIFVVIIETFVFKSRAKCDW